MKVVVIKSWLQRCSSALWELQLRLASGHTLAPARYLG